MTATPTTEKVLNRAAFENLTPEQQRGHYAEFGFVLLPEIVTPEQMTRMVLARAGDAVMFHNRTLHAGGVMQSGRPRPSVFLSYRPGWAAPLGTVPEWPEQIVNGAAPELRRLLAEQNDGSRVGAYGIVQP